MIFINFMLSQFDAALAKLQNIQRTCCHMSRLRPLMSTKPHFCVAFGAPRLVTNFRVPTGCAKYSMICMVLRTLVSETTLCITFGARRRWRPASLLGSPGPSRSTKNTVKRAVRCTRVSRTSVCVAFGARGLAAGTSGHGPTSVIREEP